MPKTPEQLIRADIRALSAYHVPDSSGFIKLDAMENPYRLPQALREAIGALAADAALNRYPDPAAGALKETLGAAMAVPPGMQMLLGNGSDEIIQMVALAVARPGAVVLGLEPSFVMFRMVAQFAGMQYASVALTDTFEIDVAATLAAISRHSPSLMFIAYPNNPTGNLFAAADIETIIEACPGLVVVDEAYHAFAGQSFMPRLADFENLLVMRTVSKLGLAGLRLGALVGRGTWLQQIDKVRLPYNVNVLTQLVASEVLRHGDVLDAQAAATRNERSWLMEELRGLSGVVAYPSDANFILFRISNAGRVFDGLRQRGVLLKSFAGGPGQLADCLRVTVGTPEENRIFAAALRDVLAAG